jgi:hypothetical protein
MSLIWKIKRRGIGRLSNVWRVLGGKAFGVEPKQGREAACPLNAFVTASCFNLGFCAILHVKPSHQNPVVSPRLKKVIPPLRHDMVVLKGDMPIPLYAVTLR